MSHINILKSACLATLRAYRQGLHEALVVEQANANDRLAVAALTTMLVETDNAVRAKELELLQLAQF